MVCSLCHRWTSVEQAGNIGKIHGAIFGRGLPQHAHTRNVSTEASEHLTLGLGNKGAAFYTILYRSTAQNISALSLAYSSVRFRFVPPQSCHYCCWRSPAIIAAGASTDAKDHGKASMTCLTHLPIAYSSCCLLIMACLHSTRRHSGHLIHYKHSTLTRSMAPLQRSTRLDRLEHANVLPALALSPHGMTWPTPPTRPPIGAARGVGHRTAPSQ
jgi:hypothetical protein